jgi:hypothetical protein
MRRHHNSSFLWDNDLWDKQRFGDGGWGYDHWRAPTLTDFAQRTGFE